MHFWENVSPEWLEEEYKRWQQAPDTFTPEWHAFFSGFELNQTAPATEITAQKQSSVESLIYRYRDIGHLLACTDPLSPCALTHPLLELAAFDLQESDLDTVFHSRRFLKKRATLREIIETLQETYCRSIGVEYMHIQDPSQRQWLMERMEPNHNRPTLSKEEQLGILGKLMEATLFEEFLHRTFLGQKRFSLEGGEALVPLLETVVREAARKGVTDLILGMPHRGRLTVLASIFQKPYHNIFAEFQDNLQHGVIGEGDVKYHKGFSTDRTFDNRTIHLSIVANPSHLEAVDGVVEGKTRARQENLGPDAGTKVLPLVIHGDAAFAGQGVVAEVFNMSQLDGYGTGGTLHIVLNNQIGFTTLPEEARSTRYATDVAKMVEAPVFHVHGENPEAVVHVARLALAYRQEFHRDVVVEIICYRRHGHNEGDEPYFTQPLMYRAIKDRPPAWRIYADQLLDDGVSQESIDTLADGIKQCIQESVGKEDEPLDEGFHGEWSVIQRDYVPGAVETGVDSETLVELARVITTLPEGFHPHPKIATLLAKRHESIVTGTTLDWGTAEALAFATLLKEGIKIRLSGQDSRRGTFNHRHSFVYDQETGSAFAPLSQVSHEQRMFRVYDSLLSENAVLAFEYGFSVESPTTLTMWEAQFGDFANGAQVIIDQFIAAGETKWDRVSGLVMLLPHGYEGQGAEHSSARIERYLQLCADNNIQVCYPSTPGQMFHLLRRQMKQPFRKPLIVFTPKSLLRNPRCVSTREELESGHFREVLGDNIAPEQVKTVILCSGKIYHELAEKRETDQRSDVAIIRIEQHYPLRLDLLTEALSPYSAATNFAWVQEEPKNMGAWNFLNPHLTALLGREIRYVGRVEAPAPAVGSHRVHHDEQEQLLAGAFQ